MTEYKKLLQLIESWTPDGVDTRDEVNARAGCYFDGHVFIGRSDKPDWFKEYRYDFKWKKSGKVFTDTSIHESEQYTHDLTALKAVQEAELEGWLFSIAEMENGGGFILGWMCDLRLTRGAHFRPDKALPTMELAWLHAIIQSIEWKRNNG